MNYMFKRSEYNSFVLSILVVLVLSICSCNAAPKKKDTILSNDKSDSEFTIYVNTQEDVNVKILNIDKPYQRGMLLKQGTYQIEASKEGFATKTITIQHERNFIYPIVLEQDNEALFLAKGNIIWEEGNSSLLNVQFTDGYIWYKENNPGNLGYSEVNTYCQYLKIEYHEVIFENFRVPSKSELVSLYKSSLPLDYKDGYIWSSFKEKDKYWYMDHGKNGRGAFTQRNRYTYPLCVQKNTLFDHNLTLIQLANNIFKYHNKHKSAYASPEKPLLYSRTEPSELYKGEFETNQYFANRVKKEQSRVDDINELRKKEYQTELTLWLSKVENLKKEHINKLAILERNKNQTYLKALTQALSIKYGDPTIDSIIYNADSQKFNIELTSSTDRGIENLFEHKQIIFVNREHAIKFKEILSRKSFSPSVIFLVSDSSLIFNGIKEIKNSNKFVEDNEFKDSYNSISKLHSFINNYPMSSYVVKSKKRIDVLDAEAKKEETRNARIVLANQKRNEKFARESREKSEKNRLAMEEAERNFSILGTCRAGNTVTHREKWNTKTSSGNIIADSLFNASIKETFVISYNGTVEGFVGNKVKVHINDYSVEKINGGGILQPNTYRQNDIQKEADKRLGKSFYYDKDRCK